MSWAENVEPGTSQWALRIVVTGMVLAAVAVALQTLPDLHLIPAGLERRFVVAELNLIFSAYAAFLAMAVAWRVGGRSEGRHLALMLAYVAACMSLSVVPSGTSELWRRLAFGVCWMGAIVEGFKFWATFPRRMKPADVQGLLARARRKGWLPLADRFTARTTAVLVGTVWGRVVFSVAALGFSYRLVRPGSHGYNILSDPAPPSLHPFPAQPILDLMGAAVILVIVGVAWTGFRLANDDERKRVLWILFAQLAVAGFTVTSMALGFLGELTASPVVLGMQALLHTIYHPAVWFVDLTGFAVAILYSGAFDLRPLINKTTVYGGLFLTLTFLFATVEEVAENVLAQRLQLPDGVGAWLGAAAIALATGPLHTKLQKFIKGMGEVLEKDLER
jgi:hypothetical protein